MKLGLHKPSPAMVVACISLFVGLSGVGTAAVVLAKNSVLSKHIKNGQVKTADLGANAVNSSKVGNGSLLAQDFAAGQLPAGPQGVQGPPGPSTGAAGGDLAGSYPNPTIGADKVTAAKIADEPAIKQSTTLVDISIETGSVQTVVQVTITAPADGFIHLSARATMSNPTASNWVDATLREGATEKRFTSWEPGDVDSNFDQTQSIDSVFAVTAGAHTYDLGLQSSDGTVSVDTADIIATYYPTALP